MQRFLQPSTGFAAALPIGRFLHLSQLSPCVPPPPFTRTAAFNKLEAGWSNCYPSLRDTLLKVLSESRTKQLNRFEEGQAIMFKRFQDQAECSQNEKTASLEHFKAKYERHKKQIEELIIHNSDLRVSILQERIYLMKSEGKFNLRGALAHMVYLAKLKKKIPPKVGTQQGLDMLAQGPEFATALQKEVQRRKLCIKDVMASINHLYERVSHCTHGNDDTFNNMVFIRASKFSDNERAALVTFFKIQSYFAIKWRVDTLT